MPLDNGFAFILCVSTFRVRNFGPALLGEMILLKVTLIKLSALSLNALALTSPPRPVD